MGDGILTAQKQRSYVITEEIVRQAVEIAFRQDKDAGWAVLFSNPTAGPWKTLTIPLTRGGPLSVSYSKEERRPDLVVYQPKTGLLLVLEAKAVAESILRGDTIEKAISTAAKERDKIQRVLKEVGERDVEILALPGFCAYVPSHNRDSLATRLRETITRSPEYGHHFQRNGCVLLFVEQMENLYLNIRIESVPGELISSLYEGLPDAVTLSD